MRANVSVPARLHSPTCGSSSKQPPTRSRIPLIPHPNITRVFGQDGTGGYAALWLTRPGLALAEQPVVFLRSVKESAVIARNLGDSYGCWPKASDPVRQQTRASAGAPRAPTR